MSSPRFLVFELQFDREAELRIQGLCEQLARQFELTPGPGILAPPHVTLGMFPGAEPADTLELVTRLVAVIPPFELEFSSVETFPGSGGVVFLKPAPSSELARAHQVFCDLLREDRCLLHPYSEPGSWQPHCTLALGVPEARLSDVLRATESRGTFGSVRVERVVVNRYFPLTRVCGLALHPVDSLAGACRSRSSWRRPHRARRGGCTAAGGTRPSAAWGRSRMMPRRTSQTPRRDRLAGEAAAKKRRSAIGAQSFRQPILSNVPITRERAVSERLLLAYSEY